MARSPTRQVLAKEERHDMVRRAQAVLRSFAVAEGETFTGDSLEAQSDSVPMRAVTRVGGLEPSSSAIHGFGRLWRKVHRIGFGAVDVEPTEVIRTWRAHFGEFWPQGNRFQAPVTRLQSGEVAVLSLEMPGGTRLATGVLVLYADDESFTLMTSHGHMFAGWITFSAWRQEGETMAQAEIVMRATDPIFEIGLELFGHRRENEFWEHTLHELALRFGVDREAQTRMMCIDRRRQWRYVRNIWDNSAIRSVLNIGLTPIRRMGRRAQHGQPTSRDSAR